MCFLYQFFGFDWAVFSSDGLMGKKLLASSFRFLAEFTPLWLYDCWPKATLNSQEILVVPCHVDLLSQALSQYDSYFMESKGESLSLQFTMTESCIK